MYTFEWKPKQLTVPVLDENGAVVMEDGKIKTESKSSPFDGVIKVKPLKHQDRLKLVKEYEGKIGPTGEIEKRSGTETMSMMMEIAVKQIESVDLKRLDDGFHITSVDFLEYDEDGASVLSDIGADILKGVRLGKK